MASGLTLKLKTKSLTMLSGGSLVSTSEIFVLSTVTVQLLPAGRPPVGVSTSVVRLFCGKAGVKATLLPQLIVTPLAATLTSSLNVIEIVEFNATSVALLVGTVAVTDGAWSVVKVKTKFAVMLSGGSPASTSVTFDATTVTVQTVPTGKSDVGSRTKLLTPPGATGVTLKATGVATGHSTVNAVESRIFTFSLKLIVMLVFVATWVAPLVGIVVVTEGGVSIVKLKTKLAAMLSGGSFVSWSVT